MCLMLRGITNVRYKLVVPVHGLSPVGCLSSACFIPPYAGGGGGEALRAGGGCR
jgi:hypothetical protein